MASRGISCFITSPPGVDRPRPTRVDSRRETKKKKKEKERKDTRSCGSSFAGRVRRSLFFSSLFPRRTLIPRSRGRRVFVPTIVRPDNGPTTHAEVSILSPSIPFFSLSIAGQLLLRLLLPLCLSLTGKSFTSLVKLSHCLEFPCLTRLGHGLAGYRSNYLKPHHPTGRNIFFPAPVVVSVYCLVGSGVPRRVDVATLAREPFLSAYGVNLPRN